MNRMFKLGAALLLGAALASPAAAKKGQPAVDATLDVALEPETGFGTTFGPTFGAGVEIEDGLQLRAELSYYSWSYETSGVKLGYQRIPIAGGARKYFTVKDTQLKPFAQGMFELSFDEIETSAGPGLKASSTKVRPGLSVGGGAELPLNKQLSALALMKYHLMSDGYLGFGFGAIYRF